MDDFDQGGYLVMVTEHGIVKKTALQEYNTPLKSRGIIAMNIQEGDCLRWVLWTDGDRELLLVSNDGMSIRFHESEVRPMGRGAGGVKGMKLREGDRGVGCAVVEPDKDVLICSEKGYGKRTPLAEYRAQSRGGIGIKTLNVTEKTGPAIGCEIVDEDDQMFIVTAKGQMVRFPTVNIRVTGRSAQGGILVRMNEGDHAASITKVIKERDEPETEKAPGAEVELDAGSDDPSETLGFDAGEEDEG